MSALPPSVSETSPSETSPLVGTAHGTVRGTREGGVAVFRGIPYAAPPVGARRFAAPEPPEPWEGVRDAMAFGPTAPKRPYAPPLGRLLPDPDVSADVDLLMGANTEEYRLWFVPSGLTEKLSRVGLRLALLKFRVPRETERAYRANRPDAAPGELLGALATDLLLRVPLNRVADARAGAPGSTRLYEFGWPSPVLGLGACHALEIGFVFDNLDKPDAVALTGPDAPQELADAMHAAWVRFAATGDPGWPVWDESRPVMGFGPGTPAVVRAPRDDELRGWAPYRRRKG
ncbi:carboxylesterase family protein [Streptomyces sp. NPDC014872]|uniref:carboxylesterase family protein n=1 Tax=Streptomyces sp. NPDC014872 TaxID=3364926 RepID=UPI0036FD4EE1